MITLFFLLGIAVFAPWARHFDNLHVFRDGVFKIQNILSFPTVWANSRPSLAFTLTPDIGITSATILLLMAHLKESAG